VLRLRLGLSPMSFDDPSLWSLRYLQSFTSANIGAFYPPIVPFDTPLLTDANLRILITNSMANDDWTYAGRVSQFINTGSVNASLSNLSLRLNEPKVWQLSPEFSQYFLRFFLPRYFKQATISIFGYTGTTPDPSQPFILGL
jgi:hypothetical protein